MAQEILALVMKLLYPQNRRRRVGFATPYSGKPKRIPLKTEIQKSSENGKRK